MRAAVIGTGKISEEHLRFLAKSPRARLAAVCDLSPSMASYAVQRFGAEAAYADSNQMLRDVKPDVVHVLTPAHTHIKLVKDALEAGAHVICEKPIAPTHGEFLDLWNLAQSLGLRLIEDHNYRFNTPVVAIEQLLRDGVLGEFSEVEVRMVLNIREPGGRFADAGLPHPAHGLPAGVLHEFITHLGYLVQRFQPNHTKIAAAWSNHGGKPPFKFDDLDALILGDGTHARIRFSTYQAPDCFTLTVRGSRGFVETDLFQPHLRLYVPRPGGKQLTPLVNQFVNGLSLAKRSAVNFKNKILQRTPYEGLATFLDLTYAALQNGGEPPVTFDDMDRVGRLVDDMLDERNRIG